MLIHYNNTVSITRLVDISWEKTRQSVKTWYSVYIQPRGEKVVNWLDSQGAYREYMLMTDWSFEILIWDKISDWTYSYIVDWWQIFNDLTWIHWQYILMKEYD
jgi:hypothetical protein